jgi:integrase
LPALPTQPDTLARVAVLDFSGKPHKRNAPPTLETCLEPFLADLANLERLRPQTLRAYRYELAVAAADSRFQRPLSDISHQDLETWLVRGNAATSTVGRRIATFRHLFTWAIRRGLCTRSPLLELAPLRGRRTLPRPIRAQHEQRALDAAIANAPPPYRLMFTLLRETGMRAGEVLDLRWGDVLLDPGREALRIREAKNGTERTVRMTHCTTNGPGSVRQRAWSTRRALLDIHPISSVTRGAVSSSPRGNAWRSSSACWAIATFDRRWAMPSSKTHRSGRHWKARLRGEARLCPLRLEETPKGALRAGQSSPAESGASRG